MAPALRHLSLCIVSTNPAGSLYFRWINWMTGARQCWAWRWAAAHASYNGNHATANRVAQSGDVGRYKRWIPYTTSIWDWCSGTYG